MIDCEIPNVGVPDPELKTSPILDEMAEESLDSEFEESVCYFNAVPYPIGQYVRCGDDVLRCVGRGVWLRCAEIKP
jgi:hypothetical protein